MLNVVYYGFEPKLRLVIPEEGDDDQHGVQDQCRRCIKDVGEAGDHLFQHDWIVFVASRVFIQVQYLEISDMVKDTVDGQH